MAERLASFMMTGLGQSRRLALPLTTSGLPPTADITHRDHHFRKVPIGDIAHTKSGLRFASISLEKAGLI
jgi:hypothetical protein